MRTLGTALKQRRQDLGLTQEQAAEEYFGVERQAYSVWERGARASLNAEFLKQLADFLGTDEGGALVAIGWLKDPDDGDGASVAGETPRQPIRLVQPTQNGDELAARREAKRAAAASRQVDFRAAA